MCKRGEQAVNHLHLDPSTAEKVRALVAAAKRTFREEIGGSETVVVYCLIPMQLPNGRPGRLMWHTFIVKGRGFYSTSWLNNRLDRARNLIRDYLP